jgi:tetratricopeptide (TPR) repeat protein
MLAIKKHQRAGAETLLLLGLAFALCGCAPPGPRALLKGERLIREGKYDQAILSLQQATRLLPKNAQAYNHLGLALHGNRQFAPALAAYRNALTLDHKLPAPHYNLGCLYLEQNDLTAAVEQLTSYTLLQPNQADGWVKLGTAQLRARKLDLAEKTYRTALGLRPRDPEALNGLGVIHFQRKRPQEAATLFNAALAQTPGYSPAVLNAAVINHQYLNNNQAALEKYRQYLGLQPRPANWETVSVLARRLDLELNPPPPARVLQVSSNPPPAPGIRTNLNAQMGTPIRVTNTHPSPALASANPRLNPNPPAPPKTAAPTNQSPTNPFVLAANKPPLAEVPKTAPAPVTAVKEPEVEVTRVAEELVVKPPEEITIVRPPVLPNPAGVDRPITNPSDPSPLLVNKADSKSEKRTLLSRLNPFGGKPKVSAREISGATAADFANSNPLPVTVTPPGTLVAANSAPPPPAVPRYTYLSPAKPAAGDRRAAEQFFAEGIKAQQTGKAAQAMLAYQKATQTDPAYFEAYYNEGLAAYNLGSWKEALLNFEYALAIKPGSADARYNLALGLQRANYPADAADELLEILNENPAETRAHLSLANLYARQLNQPKLAREHYLKVLETEPRHPKAAEIRYWLAANP